MQFQPGSIYHVKIAQRNLNCPDPTLDYFPYDNVYIAHKNDEHLVQRMFRYYLIMDYTDVISTMLNSTWVEQEQTIRIHRDDLAFEGDTLQKISQFNISNPEDWFLIVPTHVLSQSRKGRRVPDISTIGYLMSDVIGRHHNININLPAIAIQTPDTKIPLLCSICANLPQYYEGKCLPGTYDCRMKAKTRLPLDLDRKQSLQASAKEVEAS